jgi:DNA primase
LLVDYFLREQAAAAGATLSGKARAAERVAEILRMVANPFEFDLLARKAADSLGVGEELLRREARKGGANNMSLRRTSGAAPARPARTAARGDAVAQAEIGLIAIALDYSEMRAEIAAQLPSIEFNDPMLGAMLEDICLSDEARATLEVRILAGLSEDQRERLSALMVGPLMVNAEGAQRMAADFISALARRRQRREVESLRRVAADTSGDDAEAAAQAVIALRRQTHDGN